MGIGVVFEVIVSALSVLGLYALVCEVERWLYCRRRYLIAVRAENGDPELAGEAEAARRIAHISSGAETEVALLFDEAPDENVCRMLRERPGAAIYVRYTEKNE